MGMLSGPNLWEELHGASTHFPIAMVLSSVVFDVLGFFISRPSLRRDLHAAGYFSMIVGSLGAFPAVVSGLFMTRGRMLGQGALFWHHAFVWPAFACMTILAVWRIAAGHQVSRRGFAIYLIASAATAGLCIGAGYWGAQLILNS